MTKRRLPRQDSFTARIAAVAAQRDQRRAEAALDRQHRALAAQQQRLTGPARVDGRGGFGPAAGRVSWRLRIPPLVSTSAQLCSVYPFVADPGLPVDGPHIGLDVYSRAVFAFSLHELYRARVITAPNMVVTGEIGTAKSSLLKCIALRGQPFGVRWYVADYKGEYERLAAVSGITPMRIGPGLGVTMNPLAGLRRHPDHSVPQWLAAQRTRRLLLLEGLLAIQLGEHLTEAERSLVEYGLDTVTRTDDATSPDRMPTPTLSQVLAAMGHPDLWRHRLQRLSYPLEVFVAESRRVCLAMQRLVGGVLGGIFDGTDTTGTRLDFGQPGAVLDLGAVRASEEITAMALTCAQAWLEAELSAPDAPPRVCIYDEFALIARHLPLIRRMREQLKLARALGITNILAFHRFSDLAASGPADSEQVRIARGLIEDCGVRVSYRQAAGSLTQAREFLGTNDTETDLLPYLREGIGMWRIGTRTFVIKHQLSAIEAPMVHTDSKMLAIPGIDDQPDTTRPTRLDATHIGQAAA
jgi:hypothetical protein